MKKRPDDHVPWMPGFRYGALLPALSLSFIVRDPEASAAFYGAVFGAQVHYADLDFAAVRVGSAEVMLHADHTHDSHHGTRPSSMANHGASALRSASSVSIRTRSQTAVGWRASRS